MENRFRYAIRSLALFAVAGLSTAHAANVDWGKAVFNSVNNLIDLDGNLFVTAGIVMVAAAAFLKLMWGIITTGLRTVGLLSVNHHEPIDLEFVLKVLFQAWVLTKLLEYWSTPVLGSTSIHHIPMYISDALVSGLAKTKADQFMEYVKAVSTNLEHPNPLAILNVVMYVLILCDMGILSLVTFILTSFAYIGEAIFVVLTPLFFWCTFFSTIFSWCGNCIQNMFSFAFYKVVGGIIIYILSDVMINFFVSGVGTDYTIAHWITLLPVVVMLSGLFLFSLLLVPLLCASIFNGAGAIGQAVTLAAAKVA